MKKATNPSTEHDKLKTNFSVKEDEIDLFELFQILMNAWKLIIAIIISSTFFAYFYALTSSKVYTAEILLAPVKEENSRVSSSLGQFGGLAAMAGISIPTDSNVERVLATLKTREFIIKFISNEKLLPVIFDDLWDKSTASWKLSENNLEPTIEDGFSVIKSAIEVKEEDSGLITLSVSWKDSTLAANWANDLVRQLNEQLRGKAITDSKKRIGYLEQELAKTTLQDMRTVLYNLLESEKQKAMLANVNEDFALEVIDPAVAPQNPEKPRHNLIVFIGMLLGCFLSIFLVFIIYFIKKFKNYNRTTKLSNA